MWSCNVAAIKILLGCKLSEAHWEVQNSVMTEKSAFSSRSKDFKNSSKTRNEFRKIAKAFLETLICQDDLAVWDLEPYADFSLKHF